MSDDEMTIEEAESIVMAWQVGANYPAHLLPMALLALEARDAQEDASAESAEGKEHNTSGTSAKGER